MPGVVRPVPGTGWSCGGVLCHGESGSGASLDVPCLRLSDRMWSGHRGVLRNALGFGPASKHGMAFRGVIGTPRGFGLP